MMMKLAAAALVWSCAHADMIEGSGATFPDPLYKAWSAAYFKATQRKVGYIPSNSEEGIRELLAGRVDFAGSDVPMRPEALTEKKLFVFPSVVGAISVVYNLQGIGDGVLKLSREALAAIFSGKARFWDDAVIAKENSALKLPHAKIKVVVRSDGSGTTYDFTYFLHRINPAFAVSKKASWHIPEKIEVSSNADVWVQMHETKNAIGYIEYSYKNRLHMAAARIENREGRFVEADTASIQEGLKYAQWSQENYYYTVITDPEGEASYPVIASTYLFIRQEKNSGNRTFIAFLDWVYRYGDEKAEALGYVPLPEKIKAGNRKFWKSQGLE